MELVRKNITIVNNPIVSHNLGIIRNKDTKTEQFRLSVKKISYALIYEASKIIPLAPKKFKHLWFRQNVKCLMIKFK